MTSEIKVRAWDKKNKKMIYDLNSSNLDEGDFFLLHGRLVSVSGTLIFQQFTGRKDKNGKEIYKGDILFNKGILVGEVKFGEYKCKNQSNHDRQMSHLGWYVKQKYFVSQIRGEKTYATEDLSLEYLFWNLQDNCSVRKSEDQNWVEIKGNKFENPELLK